MSDIGIQDTLRALILTQTSIIPTSTLTAQATAGATSVTVASNAHFPAGTRLQFLDTLGEEPIGIDSLSGSTGITLTLQGLGYAGLQYTHPNGTVVYTNGKTEAGTNVAPYIALGDPMLAFSVAQYGRGLRAHGRAGSAVTVSIYYHLLLEQSGDNTMDAESWFERQMRRARTDAAAIIAALESHWRLTVPGYPQIVKLGHFGQAQKDYIRTNWRQPAQKWDSNQFVFRLDVDLEADYSGIS